MSLDLIKRLRSRAEADSAVQGYERQGSHLSDDLLTEAADLIERLLGPAPGVIEWVKSRAVPEGVAIVTAQGIVVWLGAANQLPDMMPWPDPIKVSVDPTTYHVVAMKAKMLEQGRPVR